MGSGRRAYDLLRGYVNQEWERIRGVDDTVAMREVRQELEANSVKVERTTIIHEEISAIDPQIWAKNILGVSATADFSEIRAAFERLNTRSNPANFPEGSPESQRALEIQQQVQRAYSILTESIDSTEKRFKSLEID